MMNKAEKKLKAAIPMWDWARLHDDDLREYTYLPEGSIVLLHVDHFQLDILWSFPNDCVQWEEAGYPYDDENVIDFLSSEIGDDSGATWEYATLPGVINGRFDEKIDIDALPIVSFLSIIKPEPVE